MPDRMQYLLALRNAIEKPTTATEQRHLAQALATILVTLSSAVSKNSVTPPLPLLESTTTHVLRELETAFDVELLTHDD